MGACPANPPLRPYKVITTADPTCTFGQGRRQSYGDLRDAARAFVQSEAPYRALIYDDGCQARELTEREESVLADVCNEYGVEAVDL